MKQGRVVVLDAPLALAAVAVSLELDLPLADSVVCATARWAGGIVWTQEGDFEDLDDVKYCPKSSKK